MIPGHPETAVYSTVQCSRLAICRRRATSSDTSPPPYAKERQSAFRAASLSLDISNMRPRIQAELVLSPPGQGKLARSPHTFCASINSTWIGHPCVLRGPPCAIPGTTFVIRERWPAFRCEQRDREMTVQPPGAVPSGSCRQDAAGRRPRSGMMSRIALAILVASVDAAAAVVVDALQRQMRPRLVRPEPC